MPEPSVPSETEVRRERTESARLDNFVDGAFAFASLPKDIGARHGRLTDEDAIFVDVGTGVWSYYAAVGLLSTLIAVIALATGKLWLIAVAGFSYGLLAFTHQAADRYRARLHREPPP